MGDWASGAKVDSAALNAFSWHECNDSYIQLLDDFLYSSLVVKHLANSKPYTIGLQSLYSDIKILPYVF